MQVAPKKLVNSHYNRQNYVIIFKLTISEGWDIPRACMLYLIRDSKSKQLDEQVIGRVRRNPRLIDYEDLSDEAQDLATTAWIWGLKPEGQDKVFAVKLQDEEIANHIKIKTTRLKGLTEKIGFDVSTYLEGKDKKLAGKNLFELWRDIQSTDNSVQELINDSAIDTLILLLYGYCFLQLTHRLIANGTTPEKSRHIMIKMIRDLARLITADNPAEEQNAYEHLNKAISISVKEHVNIPVDKLSVVYGKFIAGVADPDGKHPEMMLAGLLLPPLTDGMKDFTDNLVNTAAKHI